MCPAPNLHRQIKEQLHDGRHDATDTRILAVQGLGGSGKSQLVLNYVREYREDYSTIFLGRSSACLVRYSWPLSS
jgi:putative protein kinase ArgK-like GTPase of G3E family